MTQIVTVITKDSIFMASDTRLNYNEEVEENGEKYMIIKLVADCYRKTFYLPKVKIGIQFLGIGFLKDKDKRYSLEHFLPKLEIGIKGTEGINFRMKKVFENLKKITTIGNTSNFINGVMGGFYKNKPYIGTFNTFIKNGDLEIKKAQSGNLCDSEKILQNISNKTEKCIIKDIRNTIVSGSKRKPHLIGEEVEILKITQKKANYILKGKKLFSGTQEDLFNRLASDLLSLNGKLLNPIIKEKIIL